MPHITLEYSQNLIAHIDVPTLLTDLHQSLAAQGVDIMRIKTRALVLGNSVVKDRAHNDGQMLHVAVLLLEGRDVATRKAYGQALYDILKAAVPPQYPDCAVTLEVREMVKDTYFM